MSQNPLEVEGAFSMLQDSEAHLLAKAEAKQAFTKEHRDKADALMFEALDNLVRVPFIIPGFVQDADERKNLYREIHAAEELVRELWHRVQKAR